MKAMNAKEWVLIASALFVIIVGCIAYILIRKKTKRMLAIYHKQLDEAEAAEMAKSGKNSKKTKEMLLNRKEAGELLWAFDADLINKEILHLNVSDMEFLITTVIRNDFKKVLQLETESGYELITLAKKTKATTVCDRIISKLALEDNIRKYYSKTKVLSPTKNEKFDLILITRLDHDLPDQIEAQYKRLNKMGMLFVVGAAEKENKRIIKDLKVYLKMTQYRFEISNTCNNILLVAK